MDISRPTIEKPRMIPVESYVEARANSIAQLLKAIDNEGLVSGEVTKGPRTAAQRLPRHMRRRAMAHEVRRFPRGMRQFAAPFMTMSKHRKKPPSRFARRKPTNILQNYMRRQMTTKWLETHIWHAKRFHMNTRWGYKIAERSFQRGFRATIRDSQRGCTIADKSYLSCFLIRCKCRDSITAALKSMTSEKTGPTFLFRSALDGSTECTVQLYRPCEYPSGYIGPARFSWSINKQNEHTLSIWVHPAYRDEAFKIFAEELKVKKSESDPNIWKHSDSLDGLTVETLDTSLNRFSLLGPTSLQVLHLALTLASDDAYSESHEEWNSKISKMAPAQFRDGTIITLLVEDPRISLSTHAKVRNFVPVHNDDPSIYSKRNSRIWDKDVRDSVLANRLSTKEFEKMNSELVSGTRTTKAKVPIMLVIRNRPHCSLQGVDVICPDGFGKDLWVCLQHSGAHARAIIDEVAAHLEARNVYFPFDAADCRAGREDEEKLLKVLEEKHYKRPHNRRVQFWSKLAIRYPFSFEWHKLVSGYAGDEIFIRKVVVCRDAKKLRRISRWMQGKGNLSDDDLESDELIAVKFEISTRGRPKRFGIVCVPTAEDLQELCKNMRNMVIQEPLNEETASSSATDTEKINEKPKQRDLSGFVSLDASAVETPISLKDIFAEKTLDGSLERKKANRMKRFVAKRRKEEQKMRLVNEEKEREEMENTEYIHSANRQIIGRIVSGEQSLTSGKGIAVGYVCMKAIATVAHNLSKNQSIVLLRNSTSKYYHAAQMSVIIDRIDI